MTKSVLDVEKIDMLRREKGWSMTAMCRNAKIDLKTYKKMIAGEDFYVISMFKLAKALGAQHIVDILKK